MIRSDAKGEAGRPSRCDNGTGEARGAGSGPAWSGPGGPRGAPAGRAGAVTRGRGGGGGGGAGPGGADWHAGFRWADWRGRLPGGWARWVKRLAGGAGFFVSAEW
jgi:hypothetical protein